MGKSKSKGDPAKRVTSYLMLAYSDYVACRHLLRSGFLEQGAMLAATAAEKYLKAIIGVVGMDNGDHLSGTLYKLVQRCRPELFSELDKDFLKFLERAYRLRYASASAPGFSIVINQYRTLFAIDTLVATVDRHFAMPGDAKTPFAAAIQSSDPLVADENVALDPALLLTLQNRENRVLDYKVEDDCQTVFAAYSTQGVTMAGSFTKLPELSLRKNTFMLSRG